MKITKDFWRYSTTLLIVAVVLIIIGAISIGRTTASGNSPVFKTTSAKENIARLSDENVDLRSQISQLQEQGEEKDRKIESLTVENATLKRFLEVGELVEQSKAAEAAEMFREINPQLLPESCQEQYEAYRAEIEQAVEESEGQAAEE